MKINMKTVINRYISTSLILLVSVFFCLTAEAAKIAFERGDAIWVANLDGSSAKNITKGSQPAISPDGTRVAFNTNDSQTTPERHIAIIELASGKITIFNKVPSNNSFDPAWSPNSKTLLFSTLTGKDWQLALINADGSHYQLMPHTNNFYAPTWSADGKSFFCQNLDSIEQRGLDGAQLKKWNISTILPNSSMSSSSSLNAAPNGKSLLLEADMSEASNRKNWDGPPPALWLLDLATNKTTRLTETKVFARSPYWITSEEFVFISQGENDKQPSLYRGSIKNKSFVLILKNVQTPSVSYHKNS